MIRSIFFLFAACLAAFAQPGEPQVTLVTSDIANFWRAYDAGDPGNREDALEKLYFGPASPGLRDFIESRIGSAKKLAEAVDLRYPKFYASIRPYTLEVERQRPAILSYLARYRELYPEAHFPDVYFVIGRLTSGGTTSDRGLLIGTEVFSLGSDVNATEISPSFRRAMGPVERIPLIVVHELTHTQARSSGDVPPLLSQSLNEGAADFMTELVAGKSINAHSKEWADSRRDQLFQKFGEDLKANPKALNRWLYNYSSKTGDEPADLGYWIGAEICRSYYASAPDKAKAIHAIVTLNDQGAIVRGSKYGWLLP